MDVLPAHLNRDSFRDSVKGLVALEIIIDLALSFPINNIISLCLTPSRRRSKISDFAHSPDHTEILVGISHVNPCIPEKPRLRATRYTNNQRHQSSWGEYMLDAVTFDGEFAVFRHPPGHTGILAGI